MFKKLWAKLMQFAPEVISVLHAYNAGAFPHRAGVNDADDEAASMTYTPQHIANYFIDRANAEGRSLDPLKLIKLMYVAYGWIIALTNEKLFDEPIEAWKHGPVVPSIYHEFKHYRSSAICEPSGIFDMETGGYDVPKIPKSDTTTNMILEKVWAAYSQFSGWALRNKTHEPNTPWSDTYDGTRGKVIPDDLIAQHFHAKIREIIENARDA